MKYLRRLAGAFLALLLLLCFAAPIALATPTSAKPTLLLLFTHDTHDHFLQAPMEDGGTYGGYTRLATALRKERAKAEAAGIPVVTLDAGDFSMGSLFQTIYATDAPELRALGLMGYDVTTFGNHEYDYRAQGLAAMLHAAKKPWLGSSSESPSFDRLPAIVQANYKPKPGDTATQRAWDSYPVTDYILLERGGLKIAVFGVLGVDADACAPMSNMHFEPIADAAKRVVAALEAKEQPDYIICLSHAGTDPNPKGSEDELLAKAVPGIDVIISGHTHSVTKTPLVVNNTFIVSCGAYTENLGALTLSKDAGTASLTLLPIDETLDADPDMVAMAETFKALVEARYLADYGMKYDEVLATTPFDFTPIRTFGATQAEDGLGNLISDAYLHAVKEAEGTDYVPVDFAVVASGVVRASFPAGNITVSDAFNVSPLGVGGTGTPGYPLISVYITGKELKDAFEVDASVTPLMSAAQLYGAGMRWTFNPHRMIFNKVTDCAQLLPDGTQKSIENDKLYRVVTGLYSGQMLGSVNGKSFGILSITPKDARGNPITDFEQQVIRNKDGTEVKEWYALASYLKSLGTVPQKYAGGMGRKIVAPSWNPVELLKHPNWISLMVLALVTLSLVLVAFVTYRVATRKRRKTRTVSSKRRG